MNYINNNNLIKRVSKISFSPINPYEFEKYSVCKIISSDLYDKNKEPKYDGINDPRMGTINNNIYCDTCQQEMSECPGHFGHVELATPVYNPLYISKVVIILNIICTNCSRILIDPNHIKTLQKTKKDNKITFIYKINSMKQTVKCIHCGFIQSNIRYVKDGMLITKINYNSTKNSTNNTKNTTNNTTKNNTTNTTNNTTNNNETNTLNNSNNTINTTNNTNNATNTTNNTNNATNTTNNNPTKQNQHKTKFYAEDALKILNRLTPNDIKLIGMNPKTCHPSWLIFQIFPVVPPCVRPCINFGCNLRSEDDIVYKLSKLLKANQSLQKKIQSSNSKYLEVYKEQLQWACTTLIDNNIKNIPQSQHRNNGRPLKSLKERIKGKKGRIRDNVIGKRVNNSARTVIDPDPCISVEEVGIPYEICKILTFPEKVNHFTIDKLTKLVRNGPNKYPGANYVLQINTGQTIDLQCKRIMKLCNGDIVHRHLLSSDYVLFNRQPSLHKMSMMGHKVYPMKGKSFRLNPAVTGPYNADFDGDEMNVIMPQNTLSMLEISEITCVREQIISPQSGSPIIGIIMDNILASYLLTKTDDNGHNICWLNKEQLLNIALKLPQFNGILPPPDNILIDNTTPQIKKVRTPNKGTPNINLNYHHKELWSGRTIFSMILPPNINLNYHQKGINISNNKLIHGTIAKPTIGASNGGLIHFISNHYNSTITAKFIDDLQIVTNRFLQLKGFSVGYDDVKRNKALQQQTDKIIRLAKLDVLKYIDETYEKKCKLSMQDFEQNIFNTLNKARDDIGAIVMKNINHNNSFYQMINSKAKGNILNISQILGAVGQQNLQWRGKQGRVPLIVNNRSLPYHHQFDLSASARGFIEHSYSDGLNVTEFFAHMQAGREGVIDTSCKTSDVGYLQRKLIKSLEDIKICYDMTVRNEGNRIIQFAYGGNNIDTTKIVKITKFELIDTDYDEFLNTYRWKKSEIIELFGMNYYMDYQPKQCKISEKCERHTQSFQHKQYEISEKCDQHKQYQQSFQHKQSEQSFQHKQSKISQIYKHTILKKSLQTLYELLKNEYKYLKYYRKLLQENKQNNHTYTTYHTISSQIYQSFDIVKIIEQFKTTKPPLPKTPPFVHENTSVEYNKPPLFNRLYPHYIIQKIKELEQIIKINPNTNFPFNEINEYNLKITKALIRSNLCTKKLIMGHKLTKYQFDSIIKTIINKFYSNIIDPGTAVGPIAAQSIGEPCTQLSVAYNTRVQIDGYITKNPYIGKLIDTYMTIFENNVITTHITENGKPSHILHIPKQWNLKVPGINCKTEKLQYRHITAFSRHPPNGKLIKITTKSGKQVTATLSHSFVIKQQNTHHTRHKNKMHNESYNTIKVVRGDSLCIGDLIPIKTN